MTEPEATTATVLASWLNVTPRRVNQLAKDGTVPRREDGRFDVRESVQAYIRSLQAKGDAAAAKSVPLELSAVRLERQRVALQRDQMEFHESVGALIAVHDATAYVVSVVEAVRSVLQRAPRRHGTDAQDRHRLKQVCDELLSAVIDASIAAVQSLAPADGAPQATTTPDDGDSE